jgi:hypothetical protein
MTFDDLSDLCGPWVTPNDLDRFLVRNDLLPDVISFGYALPNRFSAALAARILATLRRQEAA